MKVIEGVLDPSLSILLDLALEGLGQQIFISSRLLEEIDHDYILIICRQIIHMLIEEASCLLVRPS